MLRILVDVVSPIFLVIGIGFLVQRHLGLDNQTLSRLNFWIFVPIFMFVQIAESDLSALDMTLIAVHFTLVLAVLGLLTWGVVRLLNAEDGLRRALAASVLFYNSGNYGVPVIQLAFGQAGLAIQAVVITVSNLATFTLGISIVAGARQRDWRGTARSVLSLPMLYALAGAYAWRAVGHPLPVPIHSGLQLISDGMAPVALVTLGSQMASLRSHRITRPMIGAMAMRLCIAPLVGGLLAWMMRLHGVLAEALIVSNGFPAAVNTALLAIQFENEPDAASCLVFYSTLFSAVTVPVVIFVVRHISW